MEIKEENLLSLPVEVKYLEGEKQILFTLSLGINADHEPTQMEVWEYKKEYAKQLKNIVNQLFS